MIDPWWPLAVLAAIQVVDAGLSWRPVAFVATCLRNVGFPEPLWPMLTPVKASAAVGLVLGIWWPDLALVVSAALVLYFGVAISMHVKAGDLGRDLYVNASGMFVLCLAVFGFVLWRV